MNHQIRIGFSTEVENEDEVRALVEKCARNVLSRENVDFPAEIDITVVDADTIREMNAEYRSKDSVTDVLSFPMYEFYNGEPREELDEEPDTGCVMLGAACIRRSNSFPEAHWRTSGAQRSPENPALHRARINCL